MKRRTAGALCSLVVAVTLMATAGPASAAPLQDFYLTTNTSGHLAVAQGAVASGVGTFTETGPNSETILIAGESPIFMTQTPVFQAVTIDPRTCRAAVVAKGTFEFSQQDGEVTFGGSGPLHGGGEPSSASGPAPAVCSHRRPRRHPHSPPGPPRSTRS